MRSKGLLLMAMGVALIWSANGLAAPVPVQDFGMTSPAHGKYVGQIVFSKSPIKFKGEDEQAFADRFSYPGENVYFMAYFPKSIANRCIEEHGARPGIFKARITFSFLVNDEPVGLIEQDLNNDQLDKWTGWSDPKTPLGHDKGMLPKYVSLFQDNVLPKLKKGDNKIRMEVGYKVVADNAELENKTPLTAGEFTLVMAKDWEKEYEQPPKAVMNDSGLEKKIHEALTFRWGKTTEIVKVILTEKDWRVELNKVTRTPECKVLRVYAITRIKSGEYAGVCMATPYEVKRDYSGNGKYSDKIVWFSSGGRPNYEVKCP